MDLMDRKCWLVLDPTTAKRLDDTVGVNPIAVQVRALLELIETLQQQVEWYVALTAREPPHLDD